MKKIALHFLYLAVIAVYAYIIGCPFRRITGMNCPFCGMTRAYTAAFCGDFARAISYHPLFLLGIPFILGLAHLGRLKRHRRLFIADVVFIIVCVTAFIVSYAIKIVT